MGSWNEEGQGCCWWLGSRGKDGILLYLGIFSGSSADPPQLFPAVAQCRCCAAESGWQQPVVCVHGAVPAQLVKQAYPVCAALSVGSEVFSSRSLLLGCCCCGCVTFSAVFLSFLVLSFYYLLSALMKQRGGSSGCGGKVGSGRMKGGGGGMERGAGEGGEQGE